jgi:excisionase family DNA binding protein
MWGTYMTSENLAYTISRFCEVAGLGRAKVYELLAAGELKAVKCGGRTLIRAEEAKRFVDSLPPAELESPASLRRGGTK